MTGLRLYNRSNPIRVGVGEKPDHCDWNVENELHPVYYRKPIFVLECFIASEAKRRELLLHVYGISNNRLKSLKIIVENFWKHRNSSFFMPNSFLTWTGPTRPGPARPGRPWRSLTAYISGNIWARYFKLFYALEELFKIVVSTFEMNILKSFEMAAILQNKNFDTFLVVFSL